MPSTIATPEFTVYQSDINQITVDVVKPIVSGIYKYILWIRKEGEEYTNIPNAESYNNVLVLNLVETTIYSYTVASPNKTHFLADEGQGLSTENGYYIGDMIYLIEHDSYHIITSYEGSTRDTTFTPATKLDMDDGETFYFKVNNANYFIKVQIMSISSSITKPTITITPFNTAPEKLINMLYFNNVLPSQDGVTPGSVLKTDGFTVSWGDPTGLPDQSEADEHSVLETDGESASWTTALKIVSLILGSEIAIQSWVTDIVFAATDSDTVTWYTGNIYMLDGTIYYINTGGDNTGNMTVRTYIYLDINVSTTLLQKTTNITNAIGAGKILIASCKNNTSPKKATYQLFGASLGKGIGEDVLAHGSLHSYDSADPISFPIGSVDGLTGTLIDPQPTSGVTGNFNIYEQGGVYMTYEFIDGRLVDRHSV